MIYRCAQCLVELPTDEDGNATPCEAHPAGAIEQIPDDQ